MAKITLALGQSQSLKDKRAVLRRIKDRVHEKLGIAINEVGSQDIWQRAELGCAVTSGERRKALELLDGVIRLIAGLESGGAIIAVAKDAITFDAPDVALTIDDRGLSPGGSAAEGRRGGIDDRTGSGDKAIAQDDWIPDAWKERP
jgi:uncharacterized protein YlxP (DUF503 family)